MTSFKYYVGASIDGFIADSAGDVGWLEAFNDRSGVTRSYQEFFANVGAVVLGGATYLWLLKQLAARGESWPYAGKPVWVFTHHELPSTPGADLTFVRGDVDLWARDIGQSAEGADVWVVGGAQLAGRFLEAGVLDELHLVTVPVVLGDGISVFKTRRSAQFSLLDRVELGDGIVEDRYLLSRS